MLKFYYSGAPNPTKVALFLEETGTPYEAIPIDTRKGEQHKPEFLAVNPNAKLPSSSKCSLSTMLSCEPLRWHMTCAAVWTFCED
jgi:hypothetical protein